VADVGNVFVEQVFGLVFEDSPDRGGDVLKHAFERENVDKV
jgi:hypothetical protein